MLPRARASPEPTGTPTDRLCVLIVEDDFGVREALKLILEDEFEIVETTNGAAALRAFQSRRVDIVLLDLLLPDLDGLEVLRRIRLMDRDVPVVIASGVSVFRTGIEAMKLGASEYVLKPYGGDDILTAVHQALFRYRRRETGLVDGARASIEAHRIVALVGEDLPPRAIVAVLSRTVATVASFPRLPGSLPWEQIDSAVFFLGPASPAAQAAVADFRRAAPAAGLFVVARNPAMLDDGSPASKADRVFGVDQLGLLVNAVLARGGSRRSVATHVGRGLAYVAGHYSRPLNVGMVAAAVGISESHLAHRFPDETGMTFRLFLALVRVEIARELLATTQEKVDTIARRVGFPSGSHLSRMLSRHTGQPPTSHR